MTQRPECIAKGIDGVYQHLCPRVSSFPLHSSSSPFTVEIYDEVFEYRHFEPQEVPQGGFMTSISATSNIVRPHDCQSLPVSFHTASHPFPRPRSVRTVQYSIGGFLPTGGYEYTRGSAVGAGRDSRGMCGSVESVPFPARMPRHPGNTPRRVIFRTGGDRRCEETAPGPFPHVPRARLRSRLLTPLLARLKHTRRRTSRPRRASAAS